MTLLEVSPRGSCPLLAFETKRADSVCQTEQRIDDFDGEHKFTSASSTSHQFLRCLLLLESYVSDSLLTNALSELACAFASQHSQSPMPIYLNG